MTERRRLPNRRSSRTIGFEHEGHRYLAAGGFYPDGRLGEIFLHVPGRMGSNLQATADTAAILVSLLLQHNVKPEIIRHSITGPISIALAEFLENGEQ